MMNTRPSIGQSGTRWRIADFPALRALRLDDQDLVSLARQGFLAVERRRERRYVKLRYRRDGRQCVRYVGGPDQAQAVQAALDTLQSHVRMRRRLTALCQAAARSLRNAKNTLEPFLVQQGFRFHGDAIRKRRDPK
jgi:hypothetical protein